MVYSNPSTPATAARQGGKVAANLVDLCQLRTNDRSAQSILPPSLRTSANSAVSIELIFGRKLYPV